MRTVIAIVMTVVVSVVVGIATSSVDMAMAVFVGCVIPTGMLAEREGRKQ